MARDAVAYIERKRPALENLSQSLEAKLSLRDKTKRSLFDLAESRLDAEIEALQAELDGKTDELAQFLNRFSKTRRLLNQKALMDWFQRSAACRSIGSNCRRCVWAERRCKKFIHHKAVRRCGESRRHLLVLVAAARAKRV